MPNKDMGLKKKNRGIYYANERYGFKEKKSNEK